MPNIYVCFVWHMHQPFYKDLVSGEYHLPWTRMHALKDYFGMVQLLDEFPEIHQTFNLVPSMVLQIAEYAAGKAADPFLRLALKPAEQFSEDDQALALRYFFMANLSRMIRRYPKYAEMYDGWLASDRNPRRARQFFTPATMRDLQVLSQLAWFDEVFQAEDAEVRELIAKERGYSPEDQQLMGRKQLEILQRVLPAYRAFAADGQIEISTTPFYHPILPLVCDSSIASVSHPYVPLPSRFRYPDDARHQLERAREFIAAEFGEAPAGLWPSEGSVSDEAFAIAADTGFTWAATDNGVLTRTIQQNADCQQTYRPYLWRQDGRELRVIFRDHYLSDLLGFVYSRMDSAEAATHFVDRLHENCRSILAQGRDALVPVILDGENAWEYYPENGRAFLRELYRRISLDPTIHALTVSEALARVEPQVLDRIFPGSWINANFDIWIGAEEDNKAWDMLLRARETYQAVMNSPAGANIGDANHKLAFEELMIAEGSDWCWWYGPEHYSENRAEFDLLFRSHLANVYTALGLNPPEELGRPIVKVDATAEHFPPTALIKPVIDGEETSYFEWMGGGVYRVDARAGAMHGQRFLVQALYYGSDGGSLFLRLDLDEFTGPVRISLNFESAAWNVELDRNHAQLVGDERGVEIAYKKILEAKFTFGALGIQRGGLVNLQLSIWQGALPLDALPPDGWLRLSTTEPGDWPM